MDKKQGIQGIDARRFLWPVPSNTWRNRIYVYHSCREDCRQSLAWLPCLRIPFIARPSYCSEQVRGARDGRTKRTRSLFGLLRWRHWSQSDVAAGRCIYCWPGILSLARTASRQAGACTSCRTSSSWPTSSVPLRPLLHSTPASPPHTNTPMVSAPGRARHHAIHSLRQQSSASPHHSHATPRS